MTKVQPELFTATQNHWKPPKLCNLKCSKCTYNSDHPSQDVWTLFSDPGGSWGYTRWALHVSLCVCEILLVSLVCLWEFCTRALCICEILYRSLVCHDSFACEPWVPMRHVLESFYFHEACLFPKHTLLPACVCGHTQMTLSECLLLRAAPGHSLLDMRGRERRAGSCCPLHKWAEGS